MKKQLFTLAAGFALAAMHSPVRPTVYFLMMKSHAGWCQAIDIGQASLPGVVVTRRQNVSRYRARRVQPPLGR